MTKCMPEFTVNAIEPLQEPPRRRVWLRALFGGALALFAIVAAAYASSILFAPLPQSTALAGEPHRVKPARFFTQLASLFTKNDGSELRGFRDDRINILLLGIGGEGHDGAYLTDTIILGSIKPSTRELAMISIPRDLAVPIPGYGWRKVNHADALGEITEAGSGPAFAAATLSETLDIPIHYVVRIDFEGFKRIVDEVGGVRVQVERAFSDPLFPTADHKVRTISFEQGWQVMDGQTALDFARSRHGTGGEGSDFARSARQQKILLGLKEKLFSLGTLTNPARISRIMHIASGRMVTNAELWEMVEFAKLLRRADFANVKTRVLSDGPGEPLMGSYAGEAFVLAPRLGNFDEVRSIVRNIFGEETTTLAQGPRPPRIEVWNGTWQAGLAATVKKRLEGAGVEVARIGNAPERAHDETVIYIFSDSAREKAGEIAKIIGGKVQQEPAPFSIQADILIIVGKDHLENA